MDYVDLHTHVLWGIDDGARTVEESLEMLRLLHDLGFSTVCATPHQKVGSWVPTAEEIAERHRSVTEALKRQGLTIPLYIAAENFWDELFLTRAQTGIQPGYRQGPLPPTPDVGAQNPTRAGAAREGPSFLFELPVTQLPPRLEEQLFAFRLKGRLPVMAHPERYIPLWKQLGRVEALARSAALVIDLGAIDGAYGPEQQKAARTLLQEGLCHAATSDLHQPADIRAVAAGIAWIKKKLGPARAKALLSEGPRQILAGDLPDLPA